MQDSIARKLLQSVYDNGLIIDGRVIKRFSGTDGLTAISPYVQFRPREKGWIHYEVIFYKEEATENYKTNEVYVELHVEKIGKAKAAYLRDRFETVKNQLLSINDDWESPKYQFAIRAGGAVVCADEREIENAKTKIQELMNLLYNACEPIFCAIEKERMATMQNELTEKVKGLLETSKQVILTGAPGTGKTYLARQIARSMVYWVSGLRSPPAELRVRPPRPQRLRLSQRWRAESSVPRAILRRSSFCCGQWHRGPATISRPGRHTSTRACR